MQLIGWGGTGSRVVKGAEGSSRTVTMFPDDRHTSHLRLSLITHSHLNVTLHGDELLCGEVGIVRQLSHLGHHNLPGSVCVAVIGPT